MTEGIRVRTSAWYLLKYKDFAWRYCAALSERMQALVRRGRYLEGATEGVPAQIVAQTCVKMRRGELRGWVGNLAVSIPKV